MPSTGEMPRCARLLGAALVGRSRRAGPVWPHGIAEPRGPRPWLTPCLTALRPETVSLDAEPRARQRPRAGGLARPAPGWHARAYRRLIAAMACGLVPWLLAVEIEIADVTQSGAGADKLVQVEFRYRDPDGTYLAIALAASADNGATWGVPVKTLTGDTMVAARPGWRTAAVTWAAGVDWHDRSSTEMRIKIVAEDALYLVVDISVGPTAERYPVFCVPEAPDLTDPRYRTTHIALRRIRPGWFTMGSPGQEVGRQTDEHQHLVRLTHAFYIGVFEVTQKQWELVMGGRPAHFTQGAWEQRPVERVSYEDIRGSWDEAGWPTSGSVDRESFLGRVRARCGLTRLDLPTEAQWEYACRAGTTTPLNSGGAVTVPWDGADRELSGLGRYWYNNGQDYQGDPVDGGTAVVGSYAANAWGLYDMHGNVWEWCLDRYGIYPGTAVNPAGATSGPFRVVRGGVWFGVAGHCRSADRNRCWPDGRGMALGFRLASLVDD